MIDWHHLFGWTLTDYFRNSNYQVNLEKDLSIKPQQLDVLIIEKSEGKPIQELPDGLENLSKHNLLSYKSLREPMDTLVLSELLGHYVNYRKYLDPDKWQQLPDNDFRLYAVSTRYPRKLQQELKKHSQVLKSIKSGVYEVAFGNQLIRVIVLSRIPKTSKNAVLQLFSGKATGFEFGQENYQWRYPPAIATLKSLFQLYLSEGVQMKPDYEDFLQQCVQETLKFYPLKERLKGVHPKEVVELFSVEELLSVLPAEDRLRGLPVEDRLRGLPAEDRLRGLSPEVLEQQLAKLKQKSL